MLRRTSTLLAAATVMATLALPAQAAIVRYEATLTGAEEVPAVNSPGTGTVDVTIDTLANTMRVQAVFSGLLGNTTAAHIHCCAAFGTNVGVATMTPSFAGFPLGVTSGSMDQTFNMLDTSSYRAAFVASSGNTAAGAWATLMAGLDAHQAYFNVHTQAFPGGEIRGQLSRVPEPATAALLLMAGLAWFGAGRRRA